jgi:tetratricopeptide (TPR) repeat protein
VNVLLKVVSGTERAPFPSGYSAAQAAKLLSLPVSRIREFVRAEFLHPRRGPRGEYRFSFQDLVILRTAKELDRELSPRKVKRALTKLKDQLPHGRDLSALRITAEQDSVVVRDGRSAWNPESGQTLIDFEVAQLAAEVAPLAREAAEAARESEEELEPDEWYELGCDLETHEREEARDAYRRALELDPRHPDAHLNLGRLLHEMGEVKSANAHYRLAMSARPRDVIAAFNLGVSLQDLGRPLDAIRAYNQAITWDPQCADAHFNLSQLYETTGKSHLAIRHLHRYRQITGEDSE